jgi:hypothetical protein
VSLFIRQTAQGRCPCGAEHAACGPPSTVTPLDVPIQEVDAVSGPLQKYRYTTEAGHETILKLSSADAELRGLNDEDLVDPGPATGEKAATAAPNKARTGSANKARTPRGKGGEGGGD